MKTLLLTLFCLFGTLPAYADSRSNCDLTLEQSRPEEKTVIAVLLHAKLEYYFCGVTNISCTSVCQCAYQTFDFVDSIDQKSTNEEKWQRRQSFLDLHRSELQCPTS